MKLYKNHIAYNRAIEKYGHGKGFSFISESSNFYFGILKGDTVHVEFATKVDEERLSLWSIANHENYHVSFGYENFDDITLRNLDVPFERFNRKKVKLIGYIFLITREPISLSDFNWFRERNLAKSKDNYLTSAAIQTGGENEYEN